jgi:phosphate transport system permease protein
MSSPRPPLRSSRRLKTRWSVRAAEVVSRVVITVGGLGTILAVLMVCVFLVAKVIPLTFPARLSHEGSTRLDAPAGKLLRLQVDDFQTMAYGLFANGEIFLIRLDDGTILDKRQLFPEARLTAISSPGRGDEVAAGFADGTVRRGSIRFASKLLKDEEVEAALRELGKEKLDVGQQAEYHHGLLSRIRSDQYRLQSLAVEFQPAQDEAAPSSSPIVQVDLTNGPGGEIACALTADNKLALYTAAKDPLTDELKLERAEGEPLSLPQREDKRPPDFLLITGLGDNVMAAWNDGHLLRINIRHLTEPKIAETVELLDRPNLQLTALTFLIGKTTLLAGDSEGGIHGWFTVHDAQPRGTDGSTLTLARTLPRGGSAAVSALHPSSRSRMLAAGYEDGTVRVFQTTAEDLLVEGKSEGGEAVRHVELSPRDDGLIAVNASGLTRWQFEAGHPEVTLRTLFLPVWYEGSPQPEHAWQTTSSDNAFEPKFGLTALVFGTLKATFYSMLIGVPLALLAAVYTSEFMNPRVKTVVKPSIELMASLPSVVLGFLAGLVFAPFIERNLTAALALLLTVPLSFLVGGHLWQLLPESRRVVLSRWRIPFIALCLPMAILAALVVGPLLERILFRDPAGQPNFRGWLDGRWGTGRSGWLLIALPGCAAFALYAIATFVNPWLDSHTRTWPRRRTAWISLAKLAAGCLLTVLLSFGVAELLTVCGLDPRGSLLGTYVQRNALIVGFGMGFAIIPIIFTIADDAMSAVPAHLRSASLGCGATHWQTAMRVVVPTAASGIFSAVMIGLGRAVGETMIVLMAAGNTPLIDLNPFNGFLTLAANLAVEMKEAARGSTHERTLYLGALILFAITFVLNTAAEVVRQRFRKRALQL